MSKNSFNSQIMDRAKERLRNFYRWKFFHSLKTDHILALADMGFVFTSKTITDCKKEFINWLIINPGYQAGTPEEVIENIRLGQTSLLPTLDT